MLVNSEAGAYIYLLNLAADQSVSLLYPNEQLPEKKQSSDRFEFPPAALGAVMKLQFYPLVEGMMSRESIRVISSFSRVDLTPVLQPPATGSAAGQWQRAEEELARMKKHEGWNEQVLDYQVGPDCPN